MDLEALKKKWPDGSYRRGNLLSNNTSALLTEAVIDILALIAKLEEVKGRIQRLEDDLEAEKDDHGDEARAHEREIDEMGTQIAELEMKLLEARNA